MPSGCRIIFVLASLSSISAKNSACLPAFCSTIKNLASASSNASLALSSFLAISNSLTRLSIAYPLLIISRVILEGIVILITNRSKKDSFFDPLPLPPFDDFLGITHPFLACSISARKSAKRVIILIWGSLLHLGLLRLFGSLLFYGLLRVIGSLLILGLLSIFGSLTLGGFLSASGSLLHLGLLRLFGSLLCSGLLSYSGSLISYGFLTSYGSLVAPGLLSLSGSLLHLGFLLVFGSLLCPGFLAFCGSLTPSLWLLSYIPGNKTLTRRFTCILVNKCHSYNSSF